VFYIKPFLECQFLFYTLRLIRLCDTSLQTHEAYHPKSPLFVDCALVVAAMKPKCIQLAAYKIDAQSDADLFVQGKHCCRTCLMVLISTHLFHGADQYWQSLSHAEVILSHNVLMNGQEPACIIRHQTAVLMVFLAGKSLNVWSYTV